MEDRLIRLERTVRMQRFYLLIMLMIAGGAAVMGFNKADGIADVLRARSIEVVNQLDEPVVRISTNDEDGGMIQVAHMLGLNGDAPVSLVVIKGDSKAGQIAVNDLIGKPIWTAPGE